MSLLARLFARQPKAETRHAGGFTALAMADRAAAIRGHRGVAELTSTVQARVGLWESGLSVAEVDGAGDLLTPSTLALVARTVALRGEFVALIDGDRLVPAMDHDATTSGGRPRAYRLSLPESGGARSVTALAPEVIHIAIGADAREPWRGTAPLHRAQLTADLLATLESALGEVFSNAPLGSTVAPMPELAAEDQERMATSFRGARGRVLLRESVSTTAAGGPAPALDWRPSSLSPSLRDAMAIEALDGARRSICAAYGVLPALFNHGVTGPVVREAQRHLARWQLQPLAGLIAAEVTSKIGARVSIDVLAPLQAYDAGGRARVLKGAVDAFAAARAAGLSQAEIEAAARFAGVPVAER